MAAETCIQRRDWLAGWQRGERVLLFSKRKGGWEIRVCWRGCWAGDELRGGEGERQAMRSIEKGKEGVRRMEYAASRLAEWQARGWACAICGRHLGGG
jgi:hypothetical protein